MTDTIIPAGELKPCPFCDGEAGPVVLPTCRPETPYDPADRLYPRVQCWSCWAEAAGADEDYTGKTAIAAWNRRAPPLPVGDVAGLVERLRAVSAHDGAQYLINLCVYAADALSRHASPPPVDMDRRVTVAKLIDPLGWQLQDEVRRSSGLPPADAPPADILTPASALAQTRTADSLAKADAILALPTGAGEWRPDHSAVASSAAPPASPIGSDAWFPIETAPKDGTLFLGCNLDHPSFGSWPMCRRVRYQQDENGEMATTDMGGWSILHDPEPDYAEGHGQGPDPGWAIALDRFSTSVRYGWRPLTAPPTSSLPGLEASAAADSNHPVKS